MTRAEIKAVFERYGPMVFRRSLGLLGNHHDAEEATQEVFVRALRSKEGQFQRRSEVSTWLYRITTNYCLNLIRDTKRRRELWEENVEPNAQTATLPAPQPALLVQKVLAAADEESSRAAIYVYIDGMSHQEASKLLGVSRRTVGNLLVRFNRIAAEVLGAPALETS